MQVTCWDGPFPSWNIPVSFIANGVAEAKIAQRLGASVVSLTGPRYIPVYFRRRRCWPSPIFLASCERATA